MKIGAHVSIANGIYNAPSNAKELGCECFQMFLGAPQRWSQKSIDSQVSTRFLKEITQNNFQIGKDYVVHTPYLINLASQNNKIYYGSINALKNELKNASQLQAPYVITHIGSAKDFSPVGDEALVQKRVLSAIEKIHAGYEGTAMLVLEIASGSGNIIGDSFEEIGAFIKSAEKQKIPLGFCFDTCHSFSAGYDLRSTEKVRSVFDLMDKQIGINNLKCIHFNDSQGKLNSHIDRHEHIGEGEIGAEGLEEVVQIAQTNDINIILETNHDNIIKDLELTKSFRK